MKTRSTEIKFTYKFSDLNDPVSIMPDEKFVDYILSNQHKVSREIISCQTIDNKYRDELIDKIRTFFNEIIGKPVEILDDFTLNKIYTVVIDDMYEKYMNDPDENESFIFKNPIVRFGVDGEYERYIDIMELNEASVYIPFSDITETISFIKDNIRILDFCEYNKIVSLIDEIKSFDHKMKELYQIKSN